MTAAEVAGWMLEEVRREGWLLQYDAVLEIEQRFGDFTYLNARGSRAISPEVLEAFRKLSGDSVVWSRRWKCWRCRDQDDEPGRGQP